MSIFEHSYGKKISGRIVKDGREIHIKNVQDAINHGIAYTTEDRKSAGLILINDIKNKGLDKFTKWLKHHKLFL